jgi:hypothetical protein
MIPHYLKVMQSVNTKTAKKEQDAILKNVFFYDPWMIMVDGSWGM